MKRKLQDTVHGRLSLLRGTLRFRNVHVSHAVAHPKRTWLPARAPAHAVALYEGIVLRIIEKLLVIISKSESRCEQRKGCFAREVLAAFNVGNLIYGQFAQVRKLLLTHVRIESQFLDSDPEIWLNWLYPFHTSECVQPWLLMTPSITTGYSVDILGGNYALEGFWEEKSKKYRIGTPNARENASIDSKEGAPTPRSTILRKSTEIPRSSANSSCVMPRSVRIERSFLPNNFRNVATL